MMIHYNKITGSVLLYVLWILVVISLLSFKLSSASKVVMTKQASEVSQIKKNLQLGSAIQFATFKILTNDWENKQYEQNLNNQRINIEIYNESGFISLYEINNLSLKNVFKSAGIDLSEQEDLKAQLEEKKLHFNDFYELAQFEGITLEDVQALIPYVSIYHEEGVNPAQSPAYVLSKIAGVDQYRVGKLIAATDAAEMTEIRNEIVEILNTQDTAMSVYTNNYYRIHVSLDSRLYRVFIKQNRRNNEFIVVNTILHIETAPIDSEI